MSLHLTLTVGIALALVVLALAHLLLGSRFRRGVSRSVARLAAAADEPLQRADVPDIVAAYARRSTPRDGAAPRLVRIRQRGQMRLAPQGAWHPFEAVQHFAVDRPGFLWRAHVGRLAPLTVVDRFVDGEGGLAVRLFGSVPLVEAGGVALARGQVMRYLAELVWVPDAVRANPELEWREVGDGIVEVAAGSGDGRGSVLLYFDRRGRIHTVVAEDRPRMEHGRTVPRRWEGWFSDYRTVGGYYIPRRGEVSWLLDSGPFTYWRGEITELTVRPRA